MAAAVFALACPAAATIVWDGKEVVAWPDLPMRALEAPSGAQFAQLGTQLFPHPSGVVRGLTILVDFSDQAPAYTKADVEAWLNQAGYKQFGLDGSVRDYYLGQSGGKVDYQNEVHGFYRAKKAKSYYQGGTSYERADELWAEVIAALDAEIDFSTFDNDGDGNTEAISLLYAGDEGTFGKGLWPHAGGSSERHDGVRLNRYMMTAMNDKPTNYVFSHESGHMLFGWPDLYGVGDYCIMANRGSDTNPVGVNDMFRADQGWIEIIDVDASTNARLSTTPDGAVYRFLNPARPTEYFLWSNLEKEKEWSFVAGSGLLVWHFDRSIGGNSPPEPLELAVVQAGGTRELAATNWPSPGSAASDLFSKSGNAELGAQTQPDTKWNDGSASKLRIYDISAPGPTMQFSVGMGPLPPESSGGSGGAGSSGGSASAGQPGASGSGGSSGVGGTGNSAGHASGGSRTSPGGAATGGTSVVVPTAGAATVTGGNSPTLPNESTVAAASTDEGCSCRMAGPRDPGTLESLLVAALFLVRRRRAA